MSRAAAQPFSYFFFCFPACALEILAARSLDMPLSLSASYVFGFFTDGPGFLPLGMTSTSWSDRYPPAGQPNDLRTSADSDVKDSSEAATTRPAGVPHCRISQATLRDTGQPAANV